MELAAPSSQAAMGSSPRLGVSSWVSGEWLEHPSSPTQPSVGLCPGDPHPHGSPSVSGRASLRWLAPLHNPAVLPAHNRCYFYSISGCHRQHKSPWGGESPPSCCYVGHFSHLSSCPACACPCQPSTLGPAGRGHLSSDLQGVKPQAFGHCSEPALPA